VIFLLLFWLTDKVSRIFSVNLLLAALSGCEWNREDVVAMTVDNLYVVTSDADLWPISSSAYDLLDGVDVLSLNAFCCGMFKHRDNVYQMIPIANIGARAHTWRNITHRSFWGTTSVAGLDFGLKKQKSFTGIASELEGMQKSPWTKNNAAVKGRIMGKAPKTNVLLC